MGKLVHHRQLHQQTCVRPSLFIAVRAVARSVTAAGSFTASSTVSSLMARCPPTRPSVVVTTRPTPSSPRLAPASTCPAPSTSTSSHRDRRGAHWYLPPAVPPRAAHLR